jgi:hypothetical protein
MISEIPQQVQWTELGESLSGPDSEKKRADILESLSVLESRANFELRNPLADAPRVQSLLEAVQSAKKLAETIFKPVDLSTL